MLSRVAESLYWIARYTERAENTARLLDVNYYATLEGGKLVQGQWAPLLAITGAEETFRAQVGRPDARSVPQWLAFDRRNPSSIVSCVAQARENARTLRDRIPSEMWECVNKAYHGLCFGTEGVLEREALHDYCVSVREASHLFFGISMATHPRDEGWAFMRAGQRLERADNVLRLLQVRYRRTRGEGKELAGALENHRWLAVLKSASAYEAYRKRVRSGLEPRRIAAFLLLDPGFPRSVRFCVNALNVSLRDIDRLNPGVQQGLLRRVGWLAARIEYADIDQILSGEELGLDQLLTEFGAIGAQIYESYFRVA